MNTPLVTLSLTWFLTKANILIDQNCQARIADFGFLTIVSDPTNPTTSSSHMTGGTPRWMGPELFALDQSDPKDSRPTKQSDCYALGMVIYEVLSGQTPYTTLDNYTVMRKVIEGERPERPEGTWFTDDLWQTLERCWDAEPGNRPSIAFVLECLEQVSGDPEPPSLQVDEDDRSLSRDPSIGLSWFDPRRLLRKIMY